MAKSLPGTSTYTVDLNCGHQKVFIAPRPLRGSLVHCGKCDDYYKVISGSDHFRPCKDGRGLTSNGWGPRTCEKCTRVFKWRNTGLSGRPPRYCPLCRPPRSPSRQNTRQQECEL